MPVDAEGSHHRRFHAMPLGPPSDPDRFDTFDECVAALSDDPDVDDPEAVCGAWKSETENDASMTHDDTEPQYRAVYHADPETVREVNADDDGLFAVRMPIASTGEVRNEGDDPLTREELDGMAAQINDGDVGVFLSHGRSFEISDARYGQTERLGSWQDGEVTTPEERDDSTDTALLEATAVMPNPEELPSATGRYRETLAILKEQTNLGIPMSASIGWREDESAPGGNDLMEASIVGIPADPRTNNTKAMARAAVDAGADPEAFVAEVRNAVMGTTDDDSEHMSESDDNDPPETVEHEGRTYVLRDEGETTDDESTERQDAPEWAERLLEMQEAQTETLQSIADELRQDDDEEEDDDDDDDMDDSETDEDDDDDEEENAQDVADLRAALDDLREGGVDVSDIDLPDPDDEQDAETADDDTETTEHDTSEDAAKSILR